MLDRSSTRMPANGAWVARSDGPASEPESGGGSSPPPVAGAFTRSGASPTHAAGPGAIPVAAGTVRPAAASSGRASHSANERCTAHGTPAAFSWCSHATAGLVANTRVSSVCSQLFHLVESVLALSRLSRSGGEANGSVSRTPARRMASSSPSSRNSRRVRSPLSIANTYSRSPSAQA